MVYVLVGFLKISLVGDVQGKNRFTTVLFWGKYLMRSLFIVLIALCVLSIGCEYQKVINVIDDTRDNTRVAEQPRVLNVGFYDAFSPVSYSLAHTHLGYEADLLTALEVMETPNLSFTRKPISQWENLWLLAATSDYDIIGGGITILEDRTKDATGTPLVAFTTSHIVFRQSLLVRAEDAERIQNYTDLTRDVRVGVLRGTTGEARLLQITGIVDANGVVAAGTRIDTPTGTVVADGTADYKITAAGSTTNIEDRFTLYPSADSMPQVNYPVNMPNQGFDPLIPRVFIALSDELVLLGNLQENRIDALARGEIGNRGAAAAFAGTLIVTALDEQVEYGGFTVARENTELLEFLNKRIDYLTDNGNIGYAQWVVDNGVFMKRAQTLKSDN